MRLSLAWEVRAGALGKEQAFFLSFLLPRSEVPDVWEHALAEDGIDIRLTSPIAGE